VAFQVWYGVIHGGIILKLAVLGATEKNNKNATILSANIYKNDDDHLKDDRCIKCCI